MAPKKRSAALLDGPDLDEDLSDQVSKTTPEREVHADSRLNQPVSSLDICVRTANTLEEKGILTVYDLLMTPKPDILRIANLGQKTYDEILGALRKLGFGNSEKRREVPDEWVPRIALARAQGSWFQNIEVQVDDNPPTISRLRLGYMLGLGETDFVKIKEVFDEIQKSLETPTLKLGDILSPDEIIIRLTNGDLLHPHEWVLIDPYKQIKDWSAYFHQEKDKIRDFEIRFLSWRERQNSRKKDRAGEQQEG
jgi:hypothetical protein